MCLQVVDKDSAIHKYLHTQSQHRPSFAPSMMEEDIRAVQALQVCCEHTTYNLCQNHLLFLLYICG